MDVSKENKEETLLSIVVPVYNVENYLERCVDSLLGQKILQYEIILVDDGSTDGSGLICDDYSKHYSNISVVHKANEGLGYARNTGIGLAKGKYIGFVDSDDYVSDDFFLNLLNGAIDNDADVCLGGMTNVFEGKMTEWIQPLAGKTLLNEEIVYKLLPSILGEDERGQDCIGMSACRGIYRNELLKEYGILFPSERELISEDAIFNILLMVKAKKIAIIGSSGYFYYHNSGTLTTRYNPERFPQCKKLFLYEENMISDFDRDSILWSRVSNMYLGNFRVCAMQEVGNNSISFAINKIKRMVNDESIQNVLKQYNYSRLPIKQRIFCLFIQNKWHLAVYLLAYIQYKMSIKKYFKK